MLKEMDYLTNLKEAFHESNESNDDELKGSGSVLQLIQIYLLSLVFGSYILNKYCLITAALEMTFKRP